MAGQQTRGQTAPTILLVSFTLTAFTFLAQTTQAQNPRFVNPTDAQYGVKWGPDQAHIPNNTVSVDGYMFATLNDESPHDNTWECKQIEALKLPPGWILAPDSRSTIKAIEMYTWNAYFGITESGVRYQTAKHVGGTAAERTFSGRHLEEGQISGQIYADILGGFKAKDCWARIMIMKAESAPAYTYNGRRYRTLHGDHPMDIERQCLDLPYRKIPGGWVLAPDSPDVANMLRMTTWNAYYGITGSGNRYYTKGQEWEESPEGFVPGYLKTDNKGGFKSRDNCGRLLLMECPPMTFSGTPFDCWPCNSTFSYGNASVTCPAGRHLMCPPWEPDPNYCWECGAGTYSAEGGNVCVPCTIGKHSVAAGATSDATCSECPAGTYQPEVGATHCIKCDPGTYSTNTNRWSEDACVAACAANEYSTVAGATTVAEAGCTACPAGKASHPGAPSCTTVPGMNCPYNLGTLSKASDAGLMDGPSSVAFVPGGLSALVVDRLNHVIREIEILTGSSTVVAGSGAAGYWDNPCDEGIWPTACPEGGVRGTDAIFNEPYGIAVVQMPSGIAALIADRGNNRIRKLELNIRRGTVTTVAGSGVATTTDGQGHVASFNEPTEIAVTPDLKYALVTERAGNTVRMIELRSAQVSTLAGSGTAGYADNVVGKLARFQAPLGIDISIDGKTAFVGDSANHRIRTIDIATSAVGTMAGSGTGAGADGVGTDATFNAPSGVAVTPDGVSLVVADTSNHLVRAIDLTTAEVSTIAGSTAASGNVDGALGASRLNQPRGITVSPDGHTTLICGDGNDVVRSLGTCPPASLYNHIDQDWNYTVNNITTGFTWRFATINNDDPADINQQCRATEYTTLPGGWILAPNSTVTIDAIKRFGHAAYFGVVATGVLHFSGLAPDTELHYSWHTSQNNYSNQLEIDGNGGYRAVHDCARVIIQQCPEGTFSLSHDHCEECATATCAGAEVVCPAGSATDSCGPCPGGQYKSDSGACLHCEPGTYSRLSGIVGQAACSSCWPGTYGPGAGATTCTACPAGKFSSGDGSTACDDTCDYQQFSTVVGATALGEGCQPCPFGNTSHKGSSRCVRFPSNVVEIPGDISAGIRHAALVATLNNELPLDDVPECKQTLSEFSPLPAGWILAPETSQVMDAIRNNFWNAYQVVTATGNRFMTAIYEESNVVPGYLETDGFGGYRPWQGECHTRIMIMGCPPGTYGTEDAFSCTPCPPNTNSHGASGYCSPLPTTYIEHNGSRWAELHQGIVPDGSGNVDCPADYLLVPGGWTLALESDAGSEHVIRNNLWNARYVATASGRTYPALDFKDDAATFSNGTQAAIYRDGLGGLQAECAQSAGGADRTAILIKECGPGTYSSSRFECSTCKAGEYSGFSEISCKACPVGTYSSVEGSSVCTDCEAGYYNDEIGGTGCKICPAGNYSGPAASYCRACLGGSFSTVVGAVDATVCQICPTQTYAGPGAPSCTPCLWDGFSSIGASYCERDPTYYVEFNGVRFATIWNDEPGNSAQQDIGCNGRQVPDGWVIAPQGRTAIDVAVASPWRSTYLVTSSGRAYVTSINPSQPVTVIPAGQLQTDETKDPVEFSTQCSYRVLIQQCPSKKSLNPFACAAA